MVDLARRRRHLSHAPRSFPAHVFHGWYTPLDRDRSHSSLGTWHLSETTSQVYDKRTVSPTHAVCIIVPHWVNSAHGSWISCFITPPTFCVFCCSTCNLLSVPAWCILSLTRTDASCLDSWVTACTWRPPPPHPHHKKQTKKEKQPRRTSFFDTLKYTVFNPKSHACQCSRPITGARSRFGDMYALTRTQIGFLLGIPRFWLICSLATGPLLVPACVNVARPGTRRRDCRVHEAAHGSPGVLEREVCRRRKLVVSLVEQSGVYVSSGLQTSGDVWYYVLTPRVPSSAPELQARATRRAENGGRCGCARRTPLPLGSTWTGTHILGPCCDALAALGCFNS